MIKVKDICLLIEEFAPLSYQESYDNSGLIFGNHETQLTGVLICLDISEPVIDEAISLGYNMIVSHHPLVFKGIKNLAGNGHVETCLIKAIKHGIAIYGGHTNVDSVINGVNGKIAEKLGLVNIEILAPDNLESGKTEQHGLGIIGELSTPIEEKEFLELVKSTFSCHTLRHSSLIGKSVKKVAVCGGSGSEFITNAKNAGATVFLTGESSFHEYFTEGMGIVLVDAGHYETEQYTKELFFELISKKIPTFALRISTEEQNPVHYF